MNSTYPIHKHIADTFTWTARVPIIVDLTLEDLHAEDLGKHLAAKGEFAFPALDIAVPRILEHDMLLCAEMCTKALID